MRKRRTFEECFIGSGYKEWAIHKVVSKLIMVSRVCEHNSLDVEHILTEPVSKELWK